MLSRFSGVNPSSVAKFKLKRVFLSVYFLSIIFINFNVQECHVFKNETRVVVFNQMG